MYMVALVQPSPSLVLMPWALLQGYVRQKRKNFSLEESLVRVVKDYLTTLAVCAEIESEYCIRA